jgi:hypothetical protein
MNRYRVQVRKHESVEGVMDVIVPAGTDVAKYCEEHGPADPRIRWRPVAHLQRFEVVTYLPGRGEDEGQST